MTTTDETNLLVINPTGGYAVVQVDDSMELWDQMRRLINAPNLDYSTDGHLDIFVHNEGLFADLDWNPIMTAYCGTPMPGAVVIAKRIVVRMDGDGEEGYDELDSGGLTEAEIESIINETIPTRIKCNPRKRKEVYAAAHKIMSSVGVPLLLASSRMPSNYKFERSADR